MIYLVIGVNQYHEDGFEVVQAFEDEEEAEEYADGDQVRKDAEYPKERYYVTEVPLVTDDDR